MTKPYNASESQLLSVCTPVNGPEQALQSSTQSLDCNSRSNLHLLAVVDDMSYFDSQVNILKTRGVKVVSLPGVTDNANLLPFLLINDHSIVLVKNPKKELIAMLKAVVRTGSF